MSFPDLLRQHSPILVSDAQISTLQQHYEMLCRWNSVMNLTAIREVEQVVLRHYCESLFVARHLPEGSWTIADVGSGPGFPGFPVAIVRPECPVTLIEAHQRKAVFLKEVSRGITNIRVLAKRAEDVTDRFDWVISRAVRLSEVMGQLSNRYALLVGDSEEGIPLPWGRNRRLLVHFDPTEVPRETSRR